YVLAHANRPARLLTEEEIAAGALKEVKALLVTAQTAPVAPKTADAIRAFTDAGGKAFCDVATTQQLPGVKPLNGFKFDRLNIWPDGTNIYHNIIAGYAA